MRSMKSKRLKLGILILVVIFVCTNTVTFPGFGVQNPGTVQAAPNGLPTHLLTGYWHNFDNGSTLLRLIDCPTSYTIVAVAFAEATSPVGAVDFTLDSKLSSSLNYSEADFINDIKKMQARGQKVIISVGGERGNVSIASSSAATNFANSIYALMQKYGFDGVDIDLEHGINSTYLTQALRQLSSKVGSSLIITMAPQTIDMQSTQTEYFKLALNIKDILTICNMQYYNSGSMLGYDGKVYAQGTVEFLTALATIQLEGGLRPDQVGLGLPAQTRAAGGGYVSPSVVNTALDSLAYGRKAGSFTPPKAYPAIRGAMTWSINWDAHNNYNWSKTIYSHLGTLPNGGSIPTPPNTPTEKPTVQPTSTPTTKPTIVPTQTPATGKANGKPGTPFLSHNNWDGDGNFDIKMNLWWGNNGTSYKLYEGNSVIDQGSLIDNSPNSQSVSVAITGKSIGSYTYKMEVTNGYGTTTSNSVTVNVTQGSTTPTPTATTKPTSTPIPTTKPTPTSGTDTWKPYVSYTAGTIVTYGGSSYKCRQPHTSLVGWEPSNVPALWQKM